MMAALSPPVSNPVNREFFRLRYLNLMGTYYVPVYYEANGHLICPLIYRREIRAVTIQVTVVHGKLKPLDVAQIRPA